MKAATRKLDQDFTFGMDAYRGPKSTMKRPIKMPSNFPVFEKRTNEGSNLPHFFWADRRCQGR